MESKKYNYCPQTKQYTFLTSKKLGKNVTFTSESLKNILRLYSDFDKKPHTAEEIFLKTNISKKTIETVVKILGFTHSTLPFLPEDIETEDEAELVDDLLTMKKASLIDSFNKKEYESLLADAQKWREVVDGNFQSIEDFVKNLTFPKTKQSKSKVITKEKSDSVYVIGLSDIHFGNIHSKKNSFNNSPNTIQNIKDSFVKLYNEIEKNAASRIDCPSVCYLFDLGDVLHSLSSFTSKGTKLGEGVYGIDQFKLAFEVLSEFIENLSYLFERVHVKSVFGNHDALHDQMIYYVLEKYFKVLDCGVDFQISTNRWLDFVILDNLIVMEHGNSPTIKNTILPEHSSKRELYINNLFSSAIRNNNYKNIKNKLFFCGDKHNIEMGEYFDFEFFRFSTPILGDGFADEKVLRNRPRFNGLIIDKNGIKEVINYYV